MALSFLPGPFLYVSARSRKMLFFGSSKVAVPRPENNSVPEIALSLQLPRRKKELLQAILERVRNSSLIERSCAEDERG